MNNNFNLVDEHWIPVLWNDGEISRVGIKEALIKASKIRQIAASNPMDRIAILRFLLAILYWCKGNPHDVSAKNQSGEFTGEWFSKLDEYKDCFNMFGEGNRFYQDRTAKRVCPATDLLQEIPSGNNFWHFRHSIDYKKGLCASCCAMGLLRLPLFSVSGLPDLKAGINGTPPIYVMPYGKTLFDTLCINNVLQEELGEPAWIKPARSPIIGQPVPLLNGLTMPSRRVFLHDPAGPYGNCIGCGKENDALIHSCEFQTAGTQKNTSWIDPHVVYAEEKQQKSIIAPDLRSAGKFRMDRPWHNLLSGIIESWNFDKKEIESLSIVGFASAKALSVDVWEMTINASEFHASATPLVQRLRKQSWQIENNTALHRSAKLRASVIADVRPHVESKVLTRINNLASGVIDEYEQSTLEYRPMMKDIAESISPGFTTVDLQRRRAIASVMPNMNPEKESAKKTSRKKGDNK